MSIKKTIPQSSPKDKNETDEAAFIRSLRAIRNIPETTYIAKVVHCEAQRGFGLLRPMGHAPENLRSLNGRNRIYFHFSDLGPLVSDGRLYIEQIVTYSLDINSKRGPRAVEIEVIHDPFKETRTKRAA